VVSWAGFEDDAPDLAALVRELLRRDGVDQAFLATVRGDEAPRIHPVYVGVVDGHLYTFANGVKRADLEQDGRYALHPHQDEAVPNEAALRGRARTVDDPAERDVVAATWSFTPGAEFGLFELDLESALIGRRDSADEWPPRYTSWHAHD
jgi:pyridoxamine 5'-phosphate oxidase-like protein